MPFFCLANIYRPSLLKGWLGRPNPNNMNYSIFIISEGKKFPFYLELCALQHLPSDFHFRIFKKKYFTKCIKKPIKILNYIYIILIKLFFENQTAKHCSEVFADVNAIYFTVLRWIMNDWDWFQTLKTQLLGAWRHSGGTAHEGGEVTSQLDQPALMPLSIAGCGWLQLGVPHWATSVALQQVVNNWPDLILLWATPGHRKLYLTRALYKGTISILLGMISIPMGMFFISTGAMCIPMGMISSQILMGDICLWIFYTL